MDSCWQHSPTSSQTRTDARKNNFARKDGCGNWTDSQPRKVKCMWLHSRTSQPIMLEQRTIDDVTTFTSLGSKMSNKGGTEEDMQARIGKAQAAFVVLNKIWRSKGITKKTKLIPMWKLFFYMAQKCGKQWKHSKRKYRVSSTVACEKSCEHGGQTGLETKTSGILLGRRKYRTKLPPENRDGLGNQQTTSRDKHRCGTRKTTGAEEEVS